MPGSTNLDECGISLWVIDLNKADALEGSLGKSRYRIVA